VSRFPGTGRSSGSRTAGRAASSPQINGATFPRPLRVGTLTQTSGAAGSGRSWSPGRTASGVSRRRAPGGHHGARPTALELERWTSRTAGQSLSTTCRVQTTNRSVDWMHGLDPILCVAKPWPWVPNERGHAVRRRIRADEKKHGHDD
jgi:hypothetical protein